MGFKRPEVRILSPRPQTRSREASGFLFCCEMDRLRNGSVPGTVKRSDGREKTSVWSTAIHHPGACRPVLADDLILPASPRPCLENDLRIPPIHGKSTGHFPQARPMGVRPVKRRQGHTQANGREGRHRLFLRNLDAVGLGPIPRVAAVRADQGDAAP